MQLFHCDAKKFKVSLSEQMSMGTLSDYNSFIFLTFHVLKVRQLSRIFFLLFEPLLLKFAMVLHVHAVLRDHT